MRHLAHFTLKNLLLLALGVCFLIYLVLLSSSLRNNYVREVNNPADLATPEGKFMEIDTAKVYYEYHRSQQQPAKATLLMIHGFGANLRTWDKQLGYLLGQYDVLLVDMLGFGLSQDIGTTSLTAENQVAMLAELIKPFGLSNLIVVGQSWGGGIAQRLALNFPEKVKGMVLINSVDLSGFTTFDSMAWIVNPLMLEIPLNIAANETNTRAYVERMYADPRRVTDAEVERYYKPFTVKNSTRNFMLNLFASSSNRLVETALITQSVLLIKGEADTWLYDWVYEHLKVGLPNQEYVEIKDAGHAVHEENALVVNQVIGNWLARYAP